MSKFYRKKPVVIEAFQLPAENDDPSHDLIDWLHSQDGEVNNFESGYDGTLIINTLEGAMTAQPLDWIIKGVNGELYPCKPDIFAKTYEVVSEQEASIGVADPGMQK